MYSTTDLIDYKAIGKRIRLQRDKANMTQEVLAEIVGVSSVHISNIENAHTKVSLPTLVAISNALQISLDRLVSDSLNQVDSIGLETYGEVFDACSPKNKQVIRDVVVALKDILSEYD